MTPPAWCSVRSQRDAIACTVLLQEDVVGRYLDPPERAVVFSFDEKTQCQALDRTQPSLPLKPGRGRTMTHDYKRNGTV